MEKKNNNKKWKIMKIIWLELVYSSVPNRRAVRNKRAGGKILKKH